MKKFNPKILTFLFLLAELLLALFFSSCDGVIFDEIRKEVKLADAEVSGDAKDIIRYCYNELEHVFVSTGEIYYRNIDTTINAAGEKVSDDTDDDGNVTKAAFLKSIANQKIEFKKFSTPSGFVYGLAANESNLYAITVTIEEDDDGYNVGDSRNLYCFDGSSWKKIWSKSYDGTTSATIFCTNTPQKEHRRAYFRYGTKVWELSGTTELTDENKMSEAKESLAEGESLSDFDNTTAPTYATKSCAYFKGEVYFSSAYSMTTNETFDTEAEATMIYYSSGDNVYYSTDASTWTAVDLNCDTIYSLGVTADYLLAGTDGGIVHTPWESEGVPKSGNADFSTNADSTLSSYYEVPAVLVVDPARTETGGTIYATSETSSSSASLNNVGLWSYYASEGEWNRE